MQSRRVLCSLALTLVVALWAGVAGAQAASSSRTFAPRVGSALGLMPPVNTEGNFNAEPSELGTYFPVVYHGGTVMSGGVTVHTIFWAPPGYAFQGSPGSGIPSYRGLIEQFYTDVAASSGKGGKCASAEEECNIFSTLTQYAEGTKPGAITPGDYSITYESGDAIEDTNPYPSGCTSPQDTKACITDEEVQEQVQTVIEEHSGSRGLHNLWFVFLPPNVDECISTDVCGTNAFGGYHSLSASNHGETTIYAVSIDPIIEVGSIPQGADPEGNPDAEIALDVAGHETNEAMTDPEGTGWMDPNGYEVADKCEFGPQHGTPLGFAANGSPYDQVINGHKYLLQEIWSNDDKSCVQSTEKTANDLPLPEVELTQFSPTVTGNIGSATAGVTVTVSLLRDSAKGTPVTVASESAETNGQGAWTLTLSRAVGDDRDQIDITYSGAGAPKPEHQAILTGNGGNPFTESGWTGWTALDQGSRLSDKLESPFLEIEGAGLEMGPCFQTGVLSYTVDEVEGSRSPTEFCSTSADTAPVELSKVVGAGEAVTVSSNDNRAFAPEDGELTEAPNPNGALVKLTVKVGESEAIPYYRSELPGFTPTGFPICAANLNRQYVVCAGLVEGEKYTLTDGSETAEAVANEEGFVVSALEVKRGDAVALSNGSRTLTTLHVADLQVALTGNDATVTSGKCSPDQYWGGPLAVAPTNLEAGESTLVAGGADLTGAICPSDGEAGGMPASEIAQTDELSGGLTETEVASVADTSPIDGETMYGAFTALAEASDEVSPIALSITPAAGGAPVFSSANVDSANGVAVGALAPGAYKATWTVGDPNGDTRTVTSRFIEESSLQGPPGPRGPQGPAAPRPKVTCKLTGRKHNKITCKVTYPSTRKGTVVGLTVARGRRLDALGHATLRHGTAVVTMKARRKLTDGRFTVTIVLSAAHARAETVRKVVRIG
ncbi:MAG TPA: hypothetical protein VMA83_07875 [Solirubrobacteraceae bacterium]|nr:hypothetical protein [Solirubrobacteraceae bacterium]